MAWMDGSDPYPSFYYFYYCWNPRLGRWDGVVTLKPVRPYKYQYKNSLTFFRQETCQKVVSVQPYTIRSLEGL